jgi:hypothetical protein
MPEKIGTVTHGIVQTQAMKVEVRAHPFELPSIDRKRRKFGVFPCLRIIDPVHPWDSSARRHVNDTCVFDESVQCDRSQGFD